MTAPPHVVSQMGLALQREVERQLLLDLEYYHAGASRGVLTVDWSNPCQEGHCTEALGGILEEMSDVAVRDRDGKLVAEGWIDFVHGGGDLPLHVFWLFLDLIDDERLTRVKNDVAIPEHVSAPFQGEQGCLRSGGSLRFKVAEGPESAGLETRVQVNRREAVERLEALNGMLQAPSNNCISGNPNKRPSILRLPLCPETHTFDDKQPAGPLVRQNAFRRSLR